MRITVSASWCGIKDQNFKSYLFETYGNEFNTDDVEYIDCDYRSICDLTGIEYFHNLQRISCFGNHLKTLNLNNNTLLFEVNCTSNQLTSLNVENCVNLKHLYCDDNQLVTLDVRRNKKLEILRVESNNLKVIDISNNPKIDTLTYINNPLEKIILSKTNSMSSASMFGLELYYGDIIEYR